MLLRVRLFTLFMLIQIANVTMAMDDMDIDEEPTYGFDFNFVSDAPDCSNPPVKPQKRPKKKGPPKDFGVRQKRSFDNYSESNRESPSCEPDSEFANQKLIDGYLGIQIDPIGIHNISMEISNED